MNQILLSFDWDGDLTWQQVAAAAELLQAYARSFENVEGFPTVFWDDARKLAYLDLDGHKYIVRGGELMELHRCGECNSTVTAEEWHETSSSCEVCFQQQEDSLYDRFRRKVS